MCLLKLFILGLFSLSASAKEPIKVLIVDTGVSSSHKALSDLFCSEEDSLDTGSGKKVIPEDTEGHGTHVAGIIRALAGDEGYCLAFCKYYYKQNKEMVGIYNTIRCLKHANDIGAEYINYSSGGSSFLEKERNAIKALIGAFYTAAGNDGVDIDSKTRSYYPAAYHLPNEVAVGSVDSQCDRTSTSNYGKDVVFFLGDEVYSSTLNGKKEYMSGTSMATAVALGSKLRSRLGLPKLGSCAAYERTIRVFWSNH